jgi:glycine oxidase
VTGHATHRDVVVVGGGIIGLACAWRLAQRGATVAVVDPSPASGASHVAAGMLAPVTEAHYGEEPLLALNLDSARRWPGFAAELADASGRPVDYEADGTLAVAYDNDDRAALGALADYLGRLGLAAERLRSSDARRLEPMLASTVRSGLWVAGDHRVDPRTVTAALRVACERTRVQVVRATARRVVLDGAGRNVTGVEIDNGPSGSEQLTAEAVVVATGAASADLPGVPPDDRSPTRPVKGQILTVRGEPGEPLLQHAVRGLVRGTSLYLVPRPDGRIIVGATVEERGWDHRPTAGAVYELLRDASLLVPGISEAELVETLVGFRPGSPDNAPIIGTGSVHGLVHATGHFRNGVLLTPVTADAVAEIVVAGRTPAVVEAFTIDRFGRGGPRTRGTSRAAVGASAASGAR